MTGLRGAVPLSKTPALESLTEDDWRHQALCREDDPELFFGERSEDVVEAKRVCRNCPVRAECLTGALERLEPYGVWGGELFVNGRFVEGNSRRSPSAGKRPPCGTDGGYYAHRRRKEASCEGCKTAHRQAEVERARALRHRQAQEELQVARAVLAEVAGAA